MNYRRNARLTVHSRERLEKTGGEQGCTKQSAALCFHVPAGGGRFIKSDLPEWACARSCQNSDGREVKLDYWHQDCYFHRPDANLKLNIPASRAGLNRNNLLSLHIWCGFGSSV